MSDGATRSAPLNTAGGIASLHRDVCMRALGARDPRFDGLFFVGITTTRIYCRPVCPARLSTPNRRRFFESAAAAERAGFRPCLRCRPELAPGRAVIDAVPRLARLATHRIAAGALNGRGVGDLARELGVSERHLRRVLEREIGVSPVELAQTHRLLLAKQLLADTTLPVTRIAYASGFQSLRRFNFVFRERYRMSPSALRRGRRPEKAPRAEHGDELVRLTLAYRAPLAWDALLGVLAREAIPGVEVADRARGRYRRTVCLDGRSGIILVEDAASDARNPAKKHLNVDVAPTLLPVLMPLLARLRQLFDLDLEPLVVDAHLAQSGLADCVWDRPGLRVPGALDGFEVVLRALLRDRALVRRVVAALGEPLETGAAGLTRLAPSAQRVADAGASFLMARGVGRRRAEALTTAAHAMASRALRLEPGSDVAATRRALLEIGGIGDRLASMILMRALHWPDAFPASSRRLRRQTGVASSTALRALAEQWRPWRAYAALHLELRERRVRRATNGHDIRAAGRASLVS